MLDCRPMDLLVRPARDRADYDACVQLQREVWGLSDLEITSAIQLVATVHAGGLLLVADSSGDGVVGFCYAFAALRGGEGHLHSDMLAVQADGSRPRCRAAPQVGATRGSAPPRPAPGHVDLRPDARAERPPEPEPPGCFRPRAPPGLLRHHELRPAPRTRHRPPSGPVGARPPARRAAEGGRGAEPAGARGPARAPRGRLAGRPARPVASHPRLRGAGASSWTSPPTGTRCALPTRGWRRSGRRSCAARSSPPSPAATRPRASSPPARRTREPPTCSGRASTAERTMAGPTRRRSRRGATRRTTTRSRIPRRASRGGPRGAAPGGRGRR